MVLKERNEQVGKKTERVRIGTEFRGDFSTYITLFLGLVVRTITVSVTKSFHSVTLFKNPGSVSRGCQEPLLVTESRLGSLFVYFMCFRTLRCWSHT